VSASMGDTVKTKYKHIKNVIGEVVAIYNHCVGIKDSDGNITHHKNRRIERVQ
jgi:hypothetical protein